MVFLKNIDKEKIKYEAEYKIRKERCKLFYRSINFDISSRIHRMIVAENKYINIRGI